MCNMCVCADGDAFSLEVEHYFSEWCGWNTTNGCYVCLMVTHFHCVCLLNVLHLCLAPIGSPQQCWQIVRGRGWECQGGCLCWRVLFLDVLCVYCTPMHSALSTTYVVDCVSWRLSLNVSWLTEKHHLQVVSATRPLLAVYARAFACVRFNIHSVCIQYTVQTQFLYSWQGPGGWILYSWCAAAIECFPLHLSSKAI